jgi:hypothetical protein
MTVAPGLFGLTLEKFFLDTVGLSLESDTDVKVLMTTDTFTPNFDTMDFRADVTNEVSGTGYTAGGADLVGTDITLTSGVLKYDATDLAWAASTITNAESAVGYMDTGNSATDQLVWCSDFGAPASTTNGTFTIQWHASGIWTLDYVP